MAKTGGRYSLSQSGKSSKCDTAVRKVRGIYMIKGQSSTIAGSLSFITITRKWRMRFNGSSMQTGPRRGSFKFWAQPCALIQCLWVRRDDNTGCRHRHTFRNLSLVFYTVELAIDCADDDVELMAERTEALWKDFPENQIGTIKSCSSLSVFTVMNKKKKKNPCCCGNNRNPFSFQVITSYCSRSLSLYKRSI